MRSVTRCSEPESSAIGLRTYRGGIQESSKYFTNPIIGFRVVRNAE